MSENKRNFDWWSLVLFILCFILVLGGILLFSKGNNDALDLHREVGQNIPMESGTTELKIEDLKVGTGEEAVAGKMITVNYSGTFVDGTKFDSSYDRGVPFEFTLGAGEVIQGWDQGFAGMKVGGKRKLTVPSSLGYGPNDYHSIPGGSTLVFEVELLKVQ